MIKIKGLDPKNFAESYIKTLQFEHDSFDKKDKSRYLDIRRVFFLEEYVRAYADEFIYFDKLEELSKKLMINSR